MAQITTQCTFPTGQPTRCDLFQDNPPGAEEAILTPVNSSSLTGNMGQRSAGQPAGKVGLPVELTLWPNPVESALSVDFRSPFSGKVQVFALTGGAALWSADFHIENHITVPARQLSVGIYTLIATEISGHRTVHKFIVSKK